MSSPVWWCAAAVMVFGAAAQDDLANSTYTNATATNATSTNATSSGGIVTVDMCFVLAPADCVDRAGGGCDIQEAAATQLVAAGTAVAADDGSVSVSLEDNICADDKDLCPEGCVVSYALSAGAVSAINALQACSVDPSNSQCEELNGVGLVKGSTPESDAGSSHLLPLWILLGVAGALGIGAAVAVGMRKKSVDFNHLSEGLSEDPKEIL
eukprot:TRINITY_DN410_c0_g1_i9.p2 TRINITY_DN410_c0_g1~~TRINITY_DN410_c0_g1_i9.p2  ORF type:complete len:211 (+),score=58.47 TRINITY_DN410_c0_g1_i9:49-681(+)